MLFQGRRSWPNLASRIHFGSFLGHSGPLKIMVSQWGNQGCCSNQRFTFKSLNLGQINPPTRLEQGPAQGPGGGKVVQVGPNWLQVGSSWPEVGSNLAELEANVGR